MVLILFAERCCTSLVDAIGLESSNVSIVLPFFCNIKIINWL